MQTGRYAAGDSDRELGLVVADAVVEVDGARVVNLLTGDVRQLNFGGGCSGEDSSGVIDSAAGQFDIEVDSGAAGSVVKRCVLDGIGVYCERTDVLVAALGAEFRKSVLEVVLLVVGNPLVGQIVEVLKLGLRGLGLGLVGGSRCGREGADSSA